MSDTADRVSDREVLECELPVFICFVTHWCHSCYPTCLIADGLARDYDGRVKFVKVDVEESPEIAERYHVTAVPTILLLQNTQPVNRLLGFQNRRTLISLLNSAAAGKEVPEGNLASGSEPQSPQPTVQRNEAHKNEKQRVEQENPIQQRIAEEERVRYRVDKDGTRWTKAYFGGGVHFRNWLTQFVEVKGAKNVKVEEADSRGFQCYEESGEKVYRIWVKDTDVA
jgi:thioredoxin 1